MTKSIAVVLKLKTINPMTTSTKDGAKETLTMIFKSDDGIFTLSWKKPRNSHDLKNWDKNDLEAEIEMVIDVPAKAQKKITDKFVDKKKKIVEK